MRQPSAVVIAGRGEKDLGLVLESTECLAVDHPVTVTLKCRSDRVFGLRPQSSSGFAAPGRVGSKLLQFARFQFDSDGHDAEGSSERTTMDQSPVVRGRGASDLKEAQRGGVRIVLVARRLNPL